MFWTVLFGVLVAYFLIKVIFPAIGEWLEDAPARREAKIAEKHLKEVAKAEEVLAKMKDIKYSETEWEKFLNKHKQIFDEFVGKVWKVEINSFNRTFEEFDEFRRRLPEYYIQPTENMLKTGGYKPFYDYFDLIPKYFNKFAEAEGVGGMKIRDDEKENRYAWIVRISEKENALFWIQLNTHLLDITMITHEARIKSLRDKTP